MTKTTLKGLN